MRYTVRKSVVYVVGKIWMPAVTGAYRYTLSEHDLASIGKPTRENVAQWTVTHCGDFQSIQDFAASLEVGDDTVEIPWATEDGELIYSDCMCEEAE